MMENLSKNYTTTDESCKYEALDGEKVSKALSMIDGKWKLKILYVIGYNEVIRYGELKRQLNSITHKMLSSELKALEYNGLIIRTEYPQIPPRVEYSLSSKGYGLLPMFDALYDWIITFNI